MTETYWTTAPEAYDGFGTVRTGRKITIEHYSKPDFYEVIIGEQAKFNDWLEKLEDRGMDVVNNETREFIRTFAATHEETWLGNINLYDHNRDKPPIWKWEGGPVCNFEAAFIIPRYDAELEWMILDRHRSEYTSVAEDSKRVKAIFDRIEQLGGTGLTWL